MEQKSISIRPFIGSQDFNESRSFYSDLGFKELPLSEKMSYFRISGNQGFYLQKYYVKDWIENSMIFLEVEDVEIYWRKLQGLKLQEKYESARLEPINEFEWGKECFLHDPSGVLWHIGQFYK